MDHAGIRNKPREVFLLGEAHCLAWTTFLRHFDCMWPIPSDIKSRLSQLGAVLTPSHFMSGMAGLRHLSNPSIVPGPRETPARVHDTLAKMILRANRRSCTDPRDKIFSILSLVSWPAGQRPLEANYEWSAIRLATQVCILMAPDETRAYMAVLGVLHLRDTYHPSLKDLYSDLHTSDQFWRTDRLRKYFIPGIITD